MINSKKQDIFTDLEYKKILELAQEIAWNSFSKKQQKKFLKLAEGLYLTEREEMALRVVKEIKKTMSKSDYVSRANPYIYLNLEEADES